MLPIGLDMHKHFSEVAVLNQDGQLEERKTLYHDQRTEMAEFFLVTVPGIGVLTAYLLLAEIGDIKRFMAPKKLCA